MDNQEIDFKYLFPNLVLFLGERKKEKNMFKQMIKSFNEFKYGPIFQEKGTCNKLGRELSTCRIMQGTVTPICLAEGEGPLPCDAEQQAVERLLDKLCDSCYVIKANPEYFTRKRVPFCALNADPSQSHIYKVVFLRKNSRGILFPHLVSGAVDYVENYEELMKYIMDHAKKGTNADLFILNVLKSDRVRIREVCDTSGLMLDFLIGCSDMGVFAYRNKAPHVILQTLLKDGGENIKYKLIGPRDKLAEICCKEDVVDKNPDEKVAAANNLHLKHGPVQNKHLIEEEEEIVISQWIADHLVVMEVVTERNELESTKEIIWRSVRDCPDTQEFIIEKKRNHTGMIFGEALIDRNVVGRARGYHINRVKIEAAENAMQNLKKYCYYIEAKKSYFGSSRELPHFLRQPNVSETKMYKIADRKNGPPNRILQQFKSAWQEDLYFLHDFTVAERKDIDILAKKNRFLVRWIGSQNYLCVYKRRKPNEILMELMSTLSKENDKYKLITPPSKTSQQIEGRAFHQEWNTQAEIQPNNRGQGFCNTSSVSDTQANTADYHYGDDQYGDHGSFSQSCDQGAEDRVQENNPTPSWVMKYIESASAEMCESSMSRSQPHAPQRQRDDVYFRYKFMPPRPNPPPVSTSINFQSTPELQRRPDGNPKLSPSKGLDHSSTLSKRLQQILEEQNWSNSQDSTNIHNEHVPCNERNNRPYDQGTDIKEEYEPAEKNFKFTLNSHLSQNNSSFEGLSTKKEGEHSVSSSEGQKSELSFQTPRRDNNLNRGCGNWSKTGSSYNEPFTGNPSFKELNDSKDNIHTMSDTQMNSLPNQNPYGEGTSGRVENTSGLNASKLFDLKPEFSHHRDPQWDRHTKQQYDQRPNTSAGEQHSYSSLFDFNGPQGAPPHDSSWPMFPPKPPPPWKKNRQFKGHSFGKLEKYGKKKGPRAPY